MAPTLASIDISLSLRMTISFVPRSPALLSASNDSPPVSAPSPMTAMTWFFSPLASRASAMPSAAEMDVLAWPTPKAS